MRFIAMLLLCVTLFGCTTEIAQEQAVTPIGDFSLEAVGVRADQVLKGAMSRNASEAELKAAVSQAIEWRFRRFQGQGRYGFRITVAGYILAQPGIPVVLAPRSLIGVEVELMRIENNVYVPVNETPKRIIAFEDAGGDTVIGSGYTQSGLEQLQELSKNLAIEIEKWMRENPQWFGATPELATPTQG